MAFHNEMSVNVLGIFLHYAEKPVLAGGLIVSAGSLHHVAAAVKLVTLLKICPALFSVFYGVVSVEVAVRILGFFNQINQPVRRILQLLIGKEQERVSCGLQPFGGVAVLENHPEKAVLRILSPKSCPGVFEVLDYMAFFRISGLIAENAVLVGDYGILNQPLVIADEAARLISGDFGGG